jgi:hypothetical protein
MKHPNYVFGLHGNDVEVSDRDPLVTPGDGPRQITALVLQDGLPRALLTVASYTPPKPTPPSPPHALTARRVGANIVVTWKPSTGAAFYTVRVRLGARTLMRQPRRPRLSVRLAGSGKLAVTLTAVSSRGLRSKPLTRTFTVRAR